MIAYYLIYVKKNPAIYSTKRLFFNVYGKVLDSDFQMIVIQTPSKNLDQCLYESNSYPVVFLRLDADPVPVPDPELVNLHPDP